MKVVKYIGGVIKDSTNKWGGTIATNNMFIRSFKNDKEYKIIDKYRSDFKNADEIAEFISDADIVHIDDTTILTMMYDAGMKTPDVIGVISRSPIKIYQNNSTTKYTKEWFYKAKIIRLNISEERDEPSLISGFINHAVDVENIIPDYEYPKKYVLWAGDIKRYAKNYEMFQEIMENPLPNGFEYKVLTDYKVNEYWNILKEVVILVNTSRYESFCSASFEAMAGGVPVIWRKNLQSGRHEDAGIRVDYDVESYNRIIKHVLTSKTGEFNVWSIEGTRCRTYVESNCTFKAMRDSIAKIYGEIKL